MDDYIVIGKETHPDGFLTDLAYGPFDDFDRAHEVADQLEKSESNLIPGYGRKYYFHVRELVGFE